MPQLNDEMFRRLTASGYDTLWDWLVVASQWSGDDAKQTNDMWFSYLRRIGYTGSISDMKLAYYADQVPTETSKHISDLALAFWSVQAPLPT